MSRPDRTVPLLGLGTWKNTDPDQCAESVETALEMGYRHVDTARLYGNERAVGRGIEAASVDRDEVVLASKLWFDELGYDDVVASTRESLDRLGVDRIDLLYVHWPAGEYDPERTLAAFADLRDEGVIDHVGVSNFTPELLDEAIDACPAPIVANQVECHPLLPQPELREHCADRDVEVVAYSPFVHGELFDVPELVEVAGEYDASVAQVTLAWFREKGVAAIPKATSESHIRDNWESRRLELDERAVERIDGIDRTERISDAAFAPDW